MKMAAFVNHRNYRRYLLAVSCLLAAILIGLIRLLTGPEFALSLFYILPIALATWYAGRWFGITVSLASAASWLIADLKMLPAFSSAWIPYLNETFRLAVFLIITLILAKSKKTMDGYKALSRTDPLTGIPNRRAFYDLAEMELNKARRYQKPLSVLYVDIDNFKNINDHFGHYTGDTLLCSVAKMIKSNIRAIDILGRFGGDEFVILLAQTGPESVALVARKLKDKLSHLVQRNNWPVTFSIGAVTFERPPARVDQLIDTADSQMYFAKNRGKNRIHYKFVAENEGSLPAVALGECRQLLSPMEPNLSVISILLP
jgi:diguanylate cyclase (GGDEF)-like protein